MVGLVRFRIGDVCVKNSHVSFYFGIYDIESFCEALIGGLVVRIGLYRFFRVLRSFLTRGRVRFKCGEI